ncbi:hypothetical protein GCM10028821_08210 [Hymenobacter jeollabukensis]|uniref:Uncharacterized protein n=1 Tax=Hymenobacter jeollabukensis TaxID=2025313 RepID=A0A5R8WU72_9BACT|nr:hypothetical protein [Hymenobacter jeollabukensis]TLM94996.1 hypothetical protein FDY95_04125 [Hymenobacter jeollabukensis]
MTINELKSIPGTKIIIALRDNLYEKTFQFGDVRGMQREKYRQLNLAIEWNTTYLKQLLNNRLALLMKEQYTNTTPTVEDFMPKAAGNKLSGFDYLIRRTLLRPRDVIAFFNKCMEKSNGQSTITRETLSLAEPEYSRERLEAVEDEWMENFGSIIPLCAFLRGKGPMFRFKDLKENDMEATLLASSPDKNNALFKIQNDYIIGSVDFSMAVKQILCILYRVGVLGAKLSSSESTMFTQSSTKTLEPTDITDEAKFYVHMMFYAALKITLRSQTVTE